MIRSRLISAPSVVFTRLLPALLWVVVGYPCFRTLLWGGPGEPAELVRRVLTAAFAILTIVLFLLRRPRHGERATLLSSVVAYTGTFAMLILAGVPLLHHDPVLLAASDAIVLVGLLWSVCSLTVLGRCFGIRPAARGLVTVGPYRLVRHPLYFGELVYFFGLILPIFSPFSVLIWLLTAGLQLRRAINEEQMLSSVFPAYQDYRGRTNFLIPFVW